MVWNRSDNKYLESIDFFVKVNDQKFEPKIVLDNLIKEKMITGLDLYKEEFGNMIKLKVPQNNL